MAPVPYKGQLTTWKDDRGFGFIKPDGGGKEIFLHISALPRASRRPEIGDTILYEKFTEPDGKVRAVKASIQGVESQTLPITRPVPTPRSLPAKRKSRQEGGWLEALVGLAGVGAIALFGMQFSRGTSPPPLTAITQPECIIKGNISHSTGNKLYHVPGMEDYEGTVIDPTSGERWFCTEAEAIAAGWQRAPR